jgi:hypothetical protein
MSRPHVHKRRLKNLLERLRYELSIVYQEHHIKYPNKDMHEVELNINDVLREIERVEFVPKN